MRQLEFPLIIYLQNLLICDRSFNKEFNTAAF